MVGGAMVGGAVLDRPGGYGVGRPVPPDRGRRGRRRSERYLLVTMGGEAGRAAAAWVGANCRHGVAQVTLLYVLTPRFRYPVLFEDSPSGYAEPLDVALAHESRIAFEEARAALDLPRDALLEIAQLGWVEPAVLRAAGSGDYHAVVMGRRAGPGLFARLRPDPIRSLWRRLACPLVVVPGGE